MLKQFKTFIINVFKRFSLQNRYSERTMVRTKLITFHKNGFQIKNTKTKNKKMDIDAIEFQTYHFFQRA